MAKEDEAKAPATPEAPELNPKMFVVPALMMGVKYLKLDLNMCVTEGALQERTHLLHDRPSMSNAATRGASESRIEG